MSVTRELWGTTRDGETVELFTLEASPREGPEGLRARFMNFGATLVSLEAPDREGRLGDVVLGFDTLEEYESSRNPYFGGIVGRCANRIAGARFELDGHEIELVPNEGRNQLHGGPRGFDRVVWNGEVDSGTTSVRFSRRSPNGEGGYPGNLDVTVTYTIQAGTLFTEYEARTDAPTLCNLTQHSYFNLAGEGTILDHELEIRAERVVEVDEELLPTGAFLDLDGTPYDFRSTARIGAQMAGLALGPHRGHDVCYPLLPGDFACRLHDPHSGRVLQLTTTQPGLQLYTGNHLDGLTGKGGRSIPRHGGLCLEAQHFPDSVHHAHFPAVRLRPGDTYSHRTEWLFFPAPDEKSRTRNVTRTELGRALTRLAQVDPVMARALELRFQRGLSEEEIAKVVGLPPDTLGRLLFKVMGWLQRELG